MTRPAGADMGSQAGHGAVVLDGLSAMLGYALAIVLSFTVLLVLAAYPVPVGLSMAVFGVTVAGSSVIARAWDRACML